MKNTMLFLVVLASTVMAGQLFGQSVKREIGSAQLRVGDKAPDFSLKVLNSEKTFSLSSNFGSKPTVLIFGSYT